MQDFDIVAEQRDAARTPVVARVAVFKKVDAAQPELAGIVASQAGALTDDGFVEELQALFGAGALGCLNADLAGFQRIEPEPDAGSGE